MENNPFNKKRLIIAMGDGFYGSAIMTTQRSLEDIKKAVKELNPKDFNEYSGTDYPGEGDSFSAGWDDPDGCEGQGIHVREVEGVDAPEPVVLMDSGNSDGDMEILKKIKEKF